MGFLKPRYIKTPIIRSAGVAGTTAATNIAVTGITLQDRLVGVVRLDRNSTAANIDISDVQSEASITSAGNIQLSTTDTTGDSLLVMWQNGVT